MGNRQPVKGPVRSFTLDSSEPTRRGAGRGLSGCKKGHRDLADDEGFIGFLVRKK